MNQQLNFTDPQKTAAYHTLGCKLNFAETSVIGRSLQQSGYKTVEFGTPADVFVLNTCSVTENADKECRMIIRNVLKEKPDTFIAVIGCYAQLKPEEIARIEGVDLVLGASEKFNLGNFLSDLTKKELTEIHSCEVDSVEGFVDAFSLTDKTRTFLKIQDGCDYSCTYCTIPRARGISRSDQIQNVVENAHEIAAAGVKEIVLTGVNIGDFKSGNHSFFDLIQQLEKVDGIDRFRISSIEPNLLSDQIIEWVAQSKKFVPHFHIPLQSGSDTILKKMKRRYLSELYKNRVEKIKSLMPNCCIGVDVIVGFPGETEELFNETYNFLHSLDISYLHVFTYSERDNTEAAEMDGVIDVNTRKNRNKKLRLLSAKKLNNFYEENWNTQQEVLFEKESKDGWIYGFTRNYIKVKTHSDQPLKNNIVALTLSEKTPEGIYLYTHPAQL